MSRTVETNDVDAGGRPGQGAGGGEQDGRWASLTWIAADKSRAIVPGRCQRPAANCTGCSPYKLPRRTHDAVTDRLGDRAAGKAEAKVSEIAARRRMIRWGRPLPAISNESPRLTIGRRRGATDSVNLGAVPGSQARA